MEAREEDDGVRFGVLVGVTGILAGVPVLIPAAAVAMSAWRSPI
jgi:hypothetical protein